jgi:hypothetical protein
VLSGICGATALVVVGIGAMAVVVPGTWLGEEASSNLIATFGGWRISMLESLPYAGGAFLLAMEIWRRSGGKSARAWWGSGRGAARLAVSVVLASGLWALTGAFTWQVVESERRMVQRGRNFYGMLALKERDVGYEEHWISLTHGRINHGFQLQRHPTWPTSYFGPETGIGLTLRHHPARRDPTRKFRVGIIGLGVGTLAAYANAVVDADLSEGSYVLAREGGEPDYTRFYEINPLVLQWARERFTFLGDAASRGADIDVHLGDARIVLERQLERGEAQRFDVLAVDAFSSDAIPIHLLTRESFETYLAHLSDDGVLALHVTNRYVDLIPIVARLAAEVGMNAIYIENHSSDSRMVNSTDWLLLTNNQEFLGVEAVHEDEEEMPEPGPLWTDDFSSVFEVLEINE